MYTMNKEIDYTFQKEDGKWYFADECEQEGGGPYDTKLLAQEALQRYAKELATDALHQLHELEKKFKFNKE